MAKYNTFKYGTGVKYGGSLNVVELYKINAADPNYAIVARHVKITVKYTGGSIWNVDTIRLLFARRQHVIPKWIIPIDRLIKRTKVTLKYTTDEQWSVDSLRLHQRIVNRGPNK